LSSPVYKVWKHSLIVCLILELRILLSVSDRYLVPEWIDLHLLTP
jgi:hypothetical protein